MSAIPINKNCTRSDGCVVQQRRTSEDATAPLTGSRCVLGGTLCTAEYHRQPRWLLTGPIHPTPFTLWLGKRRSAIGHHRATSAAGIGLLAESEFGSVCCAAFQSVSPM